MFDIGFSELLLIFVIGLVVLGPQRLPVAVKTLLGWVRALRSLATSVQNDLAQELKLQELQDSLKKVESASQHHLTAELKSSMDDLRKAAEAMKRSYNLTDVEKASDRLNTIQPPFITEQKENVPQSQEQIMPEPETDQSVFSQQTVISESEPVILKTVEPSTSDKP